MTFKTKRQRLLEGETFITSEKGNSMRPLLENDENHILTPITWDKCKVGDIVYCSVKGKRFTHLVKETSDKGCLIGNNRGKTNGWTKKVYGKVIRETDIKKYIDSIEDSKEEEQKSTS